MLDVELIELLSTTDYVSLLLQGTTIGLILAGSVCMLGYGISIALKLFKII